MKNTSETQKIPGRKLDNNSYPIEIIKRSPIHVRELSLVVKGKKDSEIVKSSSGNQLWSILNPQPKQ